MDRRTFLSVAPALVPAFCWSSQAIAQRINDDERYLIIHSDDAGMCHSVNQATIHGMTKGFVSSCSIMVPCPWFVEFAEFAKNNPQLDYGIHLTLNSEFGKYRWTPVAGRERVPSLIDSHGYLYGDKEDLIANAKPSEVEIELRAQIDRALQFGVPLSHLDTHMGTVVASGDLLDIYVRLGIDYKLPVMMIRNLDPVLSRGYPDLVAKGAEYVQLLEQSQLPVIDYLYQFYDGNDAVARQKRYVDTIRNLKPGVTQIIIHCGYDNDELKGITGSHFLRGDDTRIFCDAEVRQTIDELGVKIISWKQLRQLKFGSP